MFKYYMYCVHPSGFGKKILIICPKLDSMEPKKVDPVGGGHIIFAFSGVRTLGFRSFEGKVFILSLPNLVWVFIGLIACMGLLLVQIGL